MLINKKIYVFLCALSFFLCQNLAYSAATNVQIAMDTSGDTVAVWQEDFNTGVSEILASVLPAGGSWSTPVLISSGAGGINTVNPKIVINSSGNAVAIWSAYNSSVGYTSLYGAFLTSLTSWSSPVQISDNSEHVYDNYHVRLSDSNVMTIVWNGFSFTTFQSVIRSLSDSFGSVSAPATVDP